MQHPDDPRSRRSRELMLTAARRLLQDEGPVAVTHQRVAQAAGVGRATVYRHWAGSDELLRDVMAAVDIPFFENPRTPVRSWLIAELRIFADEMTLPALASVAVALMYQARWQSSASRVRDRQLALFDDRLTHAYAVGADAGELRDAADGPELTALLLGPIVFSAALQERSVPDHVLERAVSATAHWG